MNLNNTWHATAHKKCQHHDIAHTDTPTKIIVIAIVTVL